MITPQEGNISLIVGPMFAGKTQFLGREVTRHQYAKKRIIGFKPMIDNRFSENTITDRDRMFELPCHNLPRQLTEKETREICNLSSSYEIVIFDEVQFFSEEIVTIALTLRLQGKIVYMSGLDMSYEGKPFGFTPQLMAVANVVYKLSAVCLSCGSYDAIHTQRLVNNEPAPPGDEVLIGDTTDYEARCSACFVYPAWVGNDKLTGVLPKKREEWIQ
ncbi:thymidine kinase [Bacillus cereus]|uniref:thymidine kinase n=1 Tax=Bacillus cereus TaxID=1396 RepID=UPI000BF6ACA2|nr:thymidine kinase [Bacillus cereus]PES55536.1 thymidine kinase [Bacillus cereus]